jgi:hypothetical protein
MINMYDRLMLMLWNVNACLTPRGCYNRVMPYGVTGRPPTFQHEMNIVLAHVLRKFVVVVFIDDVLIYSKN